MAMDRPNEDEQKRVSKRKALSTASHLTRCEVVKRRCTNLKRLSYYFRAIYWLLLERMKNLYRHYVWNFNQPSSNLLLNHNSSFPTCAFIGCVNKPMPLTTFCFCHILSDPRQQLYKPCQYVYESGQDGPIIKCRKPTVRWMVPSLCKVHMEEAKKHLNIALELAGGNISSITKSPPKFHVLVAEFVNQIQARRRELRDNESEIGSETKMITEE